MFPLWIPLFRWPWQKSLYLVLSINYILVHLNLLTFLSLPHLVEHRLTGGLPCTNVIYLIHINFHHLNLFHSLQVTRPSQGDVFEHFHHSMVHSIILTDTFQTSPLLFPFIHHPFCFNSTYLSTTKILDLWVSFHGHLFLIYMLALALLCSHVMPYWCPSLLSCHHTP